MPSQKAQEQPDRPRLSNGAGGRLCGNEEWRAVVSRRENGFEVFITLDRGLEFQQNLRNREIAIVLLRSKTSRLKDLIPQVPEVLAVIGTIRPGQLVQTGH